MFSCDCEIHPEGTVWPVQQMKQKFCGEKNGIWKHTVKHILIYVYQELEVMCHGDSVLLFTDSEVLDYGCNLCAFYV